MASDIFSLKGKLTLITGGGTGFGIAQAFVSAGSRVVMDMLISGRQQREYVPLFSIKN